ncbi:ABC transporter ATP-binding protein [Pontibacter sp. G13]|uniref:ABC transporter ATP-binding protein n=1 Tax=Pontibacter sp. G13 TaxID=3074898 RepID=UPI00288A21E3|nr:ABC transporter ATP-binding protein [Pontibacter sp. G13]WNJ19891.1 ABC transporter ATP-binding protein [Pontibacter sp. G13]
MEMAISIHDLRKEYDTGVLALAGVSLRVHQGEIFGLIGPDGAGKTTLIRILATLLLPSWGKVEVLGVDPVKQYREIRRRIGYMPGRFSLYQDLSIEENMKFFATTYGTTLRKGYDTIKEVYQQIEPFKDRRAGDLSGGMKQKLALCAALIQSPELLILDEPTTGVDPVSRREFWDIIQHLNQQGMTIFVSTPYMDEAARCHRIAMLDQGNMLGVDTPDGIEGAFGRNLYAISGGSNYPVLKALQAYPHTLSVFPFGTSLHYTDQRPDDQSIPVSAYLQEAGFPDIQVSLIEAGIEDVFMARMQPQTSITDENDS